MVLLTLSKQFNRQLGPKLLEKGIRARLALGRLDAPALDSLCGLPLAQHLVRLELREQLQGVHDVEERIALWECYLRKALIPTERWESVRQWQFQHGVAKFARAELLAAKFGPHLQASYAKLQPIKQFQRNRAPKLWLGTPPAGLPVDDERSALPTTETLQRALCLQNWANHKDRPASVQSMRDVAQRLGGEVVDVSEDIQCAVVPDEACLRDESLENILTTVSGGLVAHVGPLNALCEELNVFQIWTKEYVHVLGDYLRQRTSKHSIILDIGAGDGLLAQYLRDHLTDRTRIKSYKKQPASNDRNAPLVVACDDGTWNIQPKAPVEQLNTEQALDKYCSLGNKQVIVLCSWMPLGEDWTQAFRDAGVDEYILIGERDDGQCGDPWLTWGNTTFHEEKSTAAKPYEADGYERSNLDVLLPYQFSRFDCHSSKFGSTTSFRRRIV